MCDDIALASLLLQLAWLIITLVYKRTAADEREYLFQT